MIQRLKDGRWRDSKTGKRLLDSTPDDIRSKMVPALTRDWETRLGRAIWAIPPKQRLNFDYILDSIDALMAKAVSQSATKDPNPQNYYNRVKDLLDDVGGYIEKMKRINVSVAKQDPENDALYEKLDSVLREGSRIITGVYSELRRAN